MKKVFIVIAAVCLCAFQAKAQENTLPKGSNVVGLSIGIGNTLYSGVSGSGVKKMPAISAQYERGVIGNLWNSQSSLGIGGLVGYTQAKWNSGLGYGWRDSRFIIGVRGAVHYTFVNRLDTYAGVLIGYDVVSSKMTGNWGGLNYKASSSSVAFNGFLGARYYFSSQWAAFAELGWGLAVLNIGVAYKF